MAEHNVETLAVVLDRATCTHVTNARRSAGAQWPCSTCAARAVVAAGWGHLAPYRRRIAALEDLLVCYRTGRRPPEALHRLLESTRAELATTEEDEDV